MIETTAPEGVRTTLIETLGLHDRAAEITADTLLFGDMPELDSLALVELISALEDRFGFEMDEADITIDVFESVQTLTAYVAARL